VKEELSQARFQAIFDYAGVGMAEVDAQTRVYTYVNRRFCELLGYTPEELIGRSPLAITHPDDGKVGGDLLDEMRAGKRAMVEIEKRYLRKDGSTIWMLVRITQIPGFDRNLSVHIDITSRKQAEQELRRVQESLGLALQGGRMGWWSRDLVTDQVEWSPELEAIFGLPEGTFVGGRESYLEYVHPQDRARLDQAVKKALETRGDYAVEFRFTRGDGSEGWMEGRGRAVYEGDQPVSMFGVAMDITDRKKAEQALQRSEQRLRRILEASTVGVVVNDIEGRFLYANTPMLRMLGYSREELERGEINWREVQDPRRAAQDDVALEQLRASGSCDPYETELIRKDGSRIPVYAGAALVPDDSGEGQLGAAFITDLTALKLAESELRALNAQLDARVQERTAELQEANEQMRAFTYHVSHDLRSPLRAIVATSRMIQEDHPAGLSEDAQWLLNRQAEAANKLGLLIDDLLRLSRLSREELVTSELDLTFLGREAAAEAKKQHPETRVSIEVQEGMRGEGDERLLSLALTNLIENAVKYSPEGGTVRFGCREDGAFFISDQGIGIDSKYFDVIFEPFQRLHRDNEFRGTGIGLSNARQVIVRHGGKLWVESTVGQGTTFFFTLP
jgi:PAS domain S-box-containing protein